MLGNQKKIFTGLLKELQLRSVQTVQTLNVWLREKVGRSNSAEGPGEKKDFFFCNSAGKDIILWASTPTLRPHKPLKTAGMSLCFVTLLKWGYCCLLIIRISLFSHNEWRNADLVTPAPTMSSFNNTHKSTSSSPDTTGVPSPLHGQNNAAPVLAAVLMGRPVTIRKLQYVRHGMKTAPVQKQACLFMASAPQIFTARLHRSSELN